MSGGVAYVFDERGDFTEKRCNLESVDLEPVLETQDAATHWGRSSPKPSSSKISWRGISELTGSPRAAWILDNWSEALSRFIKVFPARAQARARSEPQTPALYSESSAGGAGSGRAGATWVRTRDSWNMRASLPRDVR
jgi:glutamate synthase (NADPH) large chain